jgi:hypothetical protein
LGDLPWQGGRRAARHEQSERQQKSEGLEKQGEAHYH